MEYSKLRFWSVGKVVAPKPLDTDMVEIHALEQHPITSGEATDNLTSMPIAGLDASGNDFSGQIDSTLSVTAKWLALGQSNRISSPDVRRGEKVMLWKMADSNDEYYWTDMETGKRLLETIRWWISGHTNEHDTSKTEENGYVLMASSHIKKVLFSTSKKNGEVVRYYVQFDMDAGTLSIQDDLGQEITFDSMAGSIFITAEELIELKSKLIHFKCKKFVVDASDSIDFNTPQFNVSEKMTVGGDTLFKAKTVMTGRSNFKGGIGGTNPDDQSSPIDFYGAITHYGSWTTNGNIHATGTVTWSS